MKFKKALSIYLIIIIAISNYFIIPVNARNISKERPDPFESPTLEYNENSAEKYNYGYSNNRVSFTVLTNDTKVRREPNEHSDIIRTLDAGTEVIIVGAAQNRHGNTWFLLENDEGYIYSKKVAFNIKENSQTEYLFLKHLEEKYSNEEDATYAKVTTLTSLFSLQGDRYFENLLGRYGTNTEYIILADNSCHTISSSSMKHVYYGYLAGRVGLDKTLVLLSASNGESLAYLLTKNVNDNNGALMDATEMAIGELLSLPVFATLGPWVQVAFNSLSLFNFMDINSSLDFFDHCQKELCLTKSQRSRVTFGYNLGLEDCE